MTNRHFPRCNPALLLLLALPVCAQTPFPPADDAACERFKMPIVKPAASVDYKGVLVQPAPGVDFKGIVVYPCRTRAALFTQRLPLFTTPRGQAPPPKLQPAYKLKSTAEMLKQIAPPKKLP